MSCTKIPKFRRFVLQNFPFIEQDFDALTDYALICKVVEYLNKVIDQTNINTEQVTELSASFNELQEYVEHYFDNLDVQDEINHKLDEMVEDGTLGELIAQYVNKSKVKFYFPNTSEYGDLTVIEFSKDTEKKYAIVDFGNYSADAYSTVTAKLIAKGLTKFDYAFISHYHGDHVGMFSYMINDSRFDFSGCTFYLPPNVDWSLVTPANYAGTNQAYILTNESTIKNTLEAKGITYIQPTNSTVIEVNDDTNITFLNCDTSEYSNYYDVLVDGHTNYNNFSVVMQINHLNKRMLFTGDIEGAAQEVIITQGLEVPNLFKVNHHGVNYTDEQNADFLNKYFKPEVAVVMTNRASISRVYVTYSKFISTYVTNKSGDITVTSDGSSLLTDSENGAYSEVLPVGNFAEILNLTGLMNLGAGHPTIKIQTGDNLNDFTSYGTYEATSSDITNTLSNCPFTGAGFKMFVMQIVSFERYIQFIFKNATSEMWFRYGDGTAWETWSRYSNLGYTEALTTGTNLDNLSIGDYCTMTGTITQSCVNVPSDVTSSFTLEVRRLNNYTVGGANRLTQRLIPNVDTVAVYIRNLTSGGWSHWYKFTGTEIVPE